MTPALRWSRSLPVALCFALGACGGAEDEKSLPVATAFDPSFLDASADPCTDFYQFACGTWLAQHSAQPGYEEARFINGDRRETIYFYDLVKAMASTDPGLRSAQEYYAGCLGAQGQTTAEPGSMATQLAQVSAMTNLADLPVVLATLHRSGVRALIHPSLRVDPKNSAAYVLEISDAGWSLPALSSYDDVELSAAYQAHLVSLASAARSAAVNLSFSDPAQVLAFERDLAAAAGPTSDPTAVHDPLAEYNPRTLAELATELPGFNWTAYFSTLGFGTVNQASLLSADFLTRLAGILAVAPLATLKQYLQWRILEADADHLTRPLIDEEFRFHRTVIAGQQRSAGDDEFWCLLATRRWFGFELAHHYVDNFVSRDVKPAADTLVEALRSAMRQKFAEVTWLDDPTRGQALQKLDLLLPKVGYPDRWPTNSIRFSFLDSYLEKLIHLAQQAASDAAVTLQNPVDRSDFWTSPEITNAFYSPDRNDITIPVAVLQNPFFDTGRPAAFSYGALGSVIGHELTHAFDSSGRRFDGTGALNDWWTEAAAAEFEARSQCLVDQYAGYEALPGLAVNGQSTLNENIADLGGLKLAYAAFEAVPSAPSKGSSPFTAQQQFFLSFAQLSCSIQSEEVVKRQIANDPHSPSKFRVNGVLRNLPEFAQAFACPAGAELSPTDRCELW